MSFIYFKNFYKLLWSHGNYLHFMPFLHAWICSVVGSRSKQGLVNEAIKRGGVEISNCFTKKGTEHVVYTLN